MEDLPLDVVILPVYCVLRWRVDLHIHRDELHRPSIVPVYVEFALRHVRLKAGHRDEFPRDAKLFKAVAIELHFFRLLRCVREQVDGALLQPSVAKVRKVVQLVPIVSTLEIVVREVLPVINSCGGTGHDEQNLRHEIVLW